MPYFGKRCVFLVTELFEVSQYLCFIGYLKNKLWVNPDPAAVQLSTDDAQLNFTMAVNNGFDKLRFLIGRNGDLCQSGG